MRSREDWENCAHARALSKIDHLGIALNRTSTLIRPNDEEEKRSRAKIPTGVLPGGPGNLRTRAKRLTFSGSGEITQVPHLDKMTNIGSGRVRKY